MVAAFFKGTMRLAIALVVAGLVLILVGAIGKQAYDSYLASKAKPYEEVKSWTVDVMNPLKMTLAIRTKLVNGRLQADVRFTGYPSYLNAVTNRTGGFTFLFVDKDGFTVFQKEVPMKDFTTLMGPENRPGGMSYEFSDWLSVEEYARFTTANLNWRLDLTAGNTSIDDFLGAQPKKADFCAPGISKAERLKRLGQYGDVRQSGEDSYAAGYHTLAFFTDGSLMHCN